MGKTGIAYHHTIKVVKKYSSGEYQPGYPKIYEICDAFGEYDEITPAELKVLSEYDYLQRSGDFEKYVRRLENTENPRLLNQPVNYMPDYCPIGDDLDVIMIAMVDTDGTVNDKVTAFFSIYDRQFDTPQHTAKGNTVVCTTNDASGEFAFAGWELLYPGFPIVSYDRTYEFIIGQNTALIAKWTRESVIQLVLTAGDNVDSVTGAGKYAYNALATVDARLKDGASFSGWYRNGVLVSLSQKYSFNILEYTEFEACASMGDDAYELSVNKNSAVIIGQGGSTRVDYISRKNGISTPVAGARHALPLQSPQSQAVFNFDKLRFRVSQSTARRPFTVGSTVICVEVIKSGI
ncbi:MAG: hypothetical protein LBK58_16435 [Prevotellaceae bacterium]|jgi:hypothetical protein|nr:hypothetical protein [Prevotellaceae bacterium]